MAFLMRLFKKDRTALGQCEVGSVEVFTLSVSASFPLVFGKGKSLSLPGQYQMTHTYTHIYKHAQIYIKKMSVDCQVVLFANIQYVLKWKSWHLNS